MTNKVITMKTVYFLVMAVTVTLTIYIFSPTETFIRHNCSLSNGPCELTKDQIKLKINIGPLPLKSELPVTYNLEIDGIVPESTVVHLIGKSMHMEEEYIELEKQASGKYTATRNFPTCSEKNMVWKAVLILKQANHYVRTIFDLKVTAR